MSIGFNIKRLRSEKGLTQGELAEKSKLGLNMVSKLERDATDPKLSSLYKLMDALECTADELVLDFFKTNMKSKLKMQFERASQMPPDEQEILTEVVNKYCTAVVYELIADENERRNR
tara:strand:+ start:949 stop:1302 length:354 start_codon:yes stop_codon:yes gene_type:complete